MSLVIYINASRGTPHMKENLKQKWSFMSKTPPVNRPSTTLTYRSPPDFYVFFNKSTAAAPQSHLFPTIQCCSSNRNNKHVGGKQFVLSINQLGSPASLKQLGFFSNKGGSHIRERANLSFLKEVLFTLE